MKKILSGLRYCIILLITLLISTNSFASHILGVDLYYTWVSGNTYTITVILYGDCSPVPASYGSTPSAFSTLPVATPNICVYKGSTYVTTLVLHVLAPSTGVDITPVCPAQVNHTQCESPSSLIPGIMKFVYTANYTLPAPVANANWQFAYFAENGPGAAAGRSVNITNIQNPDFTSTELVDTLDNTVYPNNSSAQFSVIPTPFYCINTPDTYNPGCVDPNGDSLHIDLITAMDCSYSSGCQFGVPVTYTGTAWTPPNTPISGTTPLNVVAGSFSFNSFTGQLNFTPNAFQRSTVVYNVREFRGGSFVGSCQREMNFLVQSCSNTPPTGGLDSVQNGTRIDSTHFTICANTGPYSLYLDPHEATATNNITVTSSGLPTGVTVSVTNNGTPHPHVIVSGTSNGVAPGNYIFYLTYTDNNCPLAGTTTVAVTITITSSPTVTYTVVTPASCVSKAVVNIVPGGPGSPWNITVLYPAQSFTNVTGSFTDSLLPGNDSITISSAAGSACSGTFPITIASPTPPTISATLVSAATCTAKAAYNVVPGGTGSPWTVVVSGATSQTFTNVSGTFVDSLLPGVDTITIFSPAAPLCKSYAVVTVVTPNPPTITATLLSPATCNTKAGFSFAPVGGGSPWTVVISGATTHTFTNVTGTFIDSLLPGVDTITIFSPAAPLCKSYTVVTVVQPTAPTVSYNVVTQATCTAKGVFTITPAGTGAPWIITVSNGSSSQTFTGVTGVFTDSVVQGSDTIFISSPSSPLCHSYTLMTMPGTNTVTVGSISSNAPICADSTLLLSATDTATGITYSWTGPNSFTSTIQDPFITNAQTTASGIYTVTVTKTATGCTAFATINVVVKPTPAIPVLSGNNPCAVTGTLTLTASSNAGATYSWNGPAGFTASVQSPAISPADVTNTGTYTVVATLNGCPSLPGFGTYTVNPTPPPPSGRDSSYCEHGSPIPLSATGTNLLWYAAATSGTGNPTAPTPADTAAGVITWYVTQTINGCESPRTPINTNILYLPVFDITGNTNLCLGATTTLYYSGPGLNAAAYLWSLPAGASIVTGDNTVDSLVVKFTVPATSLIITLTASDYDGKCTATETVPVNVVEPPLSAFYIKPDLCINDTVVVALSYKSASATQFAWNFDGATIISANSNSGGPYSLSWQDTGRHFVSLVTSTDIGCTTPPVFDSFTVHALPDARIAPPARTDICLDDTLTLSAVTNRYDNHYTWAPVHFFSFADAPLSDNSSTVKGIIEAVGNVTLTVTDPFGCSATEEVYIDPASCCNVLFPNAFSPNGDKHNDVFRPIFNGYHRFHIFQISNRWGQIVYETSNSDGAWDGNFNGVPQDIGVYFYYLKYDCGGKTLEAKGDVTLIK